MENIIKAGVIVYAALFINVGAAVAGKDCTNTSSYANHSSADTAAEENGKTEAAMKQRQKNLVLRRKYFQIYL